MLQKDPKDFLRMSQKLNNNDAYALTMVETLVAAFRDCRELVTSRAGKVAHTDKSDGSPVTETDVAVEDQVKAVMADKHPDMPVFGEEGGYKHELPASYWLIDPIDGTRSFIDNIPAFTAMGVLIHDGDATASLIYNYSTNDAYTAIKGQGAFKNGIKIDLNTMALPPIALCKQRFVEPLDKIMQPAKVHCEGSPSGAGFNFANVLDGKAAARFSLLGGGDIHDYAPGGLLVREAGGVLLPVADDEYHYTAKSFIACHPALADTLRPHLAEIRQLEIDLA